MVIGLQGNPYGNDLFAADKVVATVKHFIGDDILNASFYHWARFFELRERGKIPSDPGNGPGKDALKSELRKYKYGYCAI